ncbi:MAG TPA: M20/M25/M40 family metallo-hydrolase [Alphaproteobacteria bacterium]|nr:M20/M25/M40 family metallo-hydrolase [Alphaproteobacteria bacterium]
MTTDRETLLAWVDAEKQDLIDFLQGFIRAKSPNPPGDTRAAADHIKKFLERQKLPYRVIAPREEMPNIVASFDARSAGRHLVLNGHIDVFPVGDGFGWTRDPWGGEIVDGKIYGRGAVDMKTGTTASIMTFMFLNRIKDRLRGRLTLTAVSDEETFGPWGARYLMEHHPEVHGDCLLNGEPGSPYSVRFGEKGPLWLEFTVRTAGAHGAYTHKSKSATKIAMKLAGELEAVTKIKPDVSDNIRAALEIGRATMDKAMGDNAADTVSLVTLNVGTIRGGLKVNMVPSECVFEVDIRLPIGVTKEQVLSTVAPLLSRFPEATMREIGSSAPSWCDPNGEMVEILQRNVENLMGFKPTPIVSLGGTDARLWRYQNIPAYVYGPFPNGMGSQDEHVVIDEFLHIVRTHVLSAYDYLTRE